jgi:hypothetical protein
MSRFRIGLLCLVTVVALGVAPVVMTAGSTASAAGDPSVTTACTGTMSGSTFTLTADCDTTVQLTVPDGVTVNGGGHTITAHDPTAGFFMGAVLTNEGTTMNIENLTIKGTSVFATNCGTGLKGIYFHDAGGFLTAVNVLNITQHNGCQTGLAIRADGITAPRTVTMTNVTASGYQKAGLVASGSMTVNVTGSTFGPPDNLTGVVAQNAVQFSNTAPGSTVGAGGSVVNSTIIGSGFGNASSAGTAVLLFGASGVTLFGDTITGAGTDIGVAVASGSTGITINRNQIGRTAPDTPDSLGQGVSVDSTSSATVTCNAFSGWITDYVVNGVPAMQSPCITAPGYWLAASDGGVFAFGAAPFNGSMGGIPLNKPVVGIANIAAGGYWLVASDGGIFSFGVPFFGSEGGKPLNEPIVGMAGTPDGGGYYLVASDGGVFTFGDAHFQGSMGGKPLNKPIVGIAVTPDNGGYYLVASDGGVFAFGDAIFQGSMGGTPLNKPVVGMSVDAATSGYWLVASDGGIFSFGAPFLGSTGAIVLNAPVVGMAATATGLGYRLVATDGGIFSFGNAPFEGSMGGKPLNKPIVGIASTGA